MRHHSTAGLTGAQTAELIARCWQVHTGRPDGDRYDFTLPFGRAVTMVLIIARHNLPQQLTGDLFGIAQATVSRIWRYLIPMIGQVTALDRKHLADALERGTVLIDGTPIPTGNRTGTGTTNYAAKHHKQALGVQVAAFRDGTLADVSTPVPGSRHDSRALDEVGWADQITAARAKRDWIAVIADTAYVKHTRLTPRKKARGQKRRSRADREHNRHIASLRAPVERTIGLLKHWKILATGYRGRLTELPTLIHIIVNLEFYRQAT
ncbi:transposase family protein [Myceligenerans xiligouense]|uniref:DDE superfamily endonuclease n=1 Tax=Myceligenerans xiligouense TaxID=253184 RepID=A0A3N4Z2V3_9MICO|nr:transposase family protein [Myceligenerans xiligouense]RPF20338.1 DDE superfamily endonuclease [Myceligenerans xiligouense]RPF20364.1 DDE superfamily endonuclease [Myceligenerans xiligouense]RPF22824.1 DDE superfamily endonuclease [Myceligenerans xiligouense]